MTNPVPGPLPRDASAETFPATHEWIRRAANLLNPPLSREPTLSVTFAANAASTTVTDARIGATTAICLQPTTANAAAAMNTWYIAEPRASGSVTIAHANNAQTDRTFRCKLEGA